MDDSSTNSIINIGFSNYRFLNVEIQDFKKFHSSLNHFKNKGYKDTLGLRFDIVEINRC